MATKITTRVLADDAVTDAKIADVTLTTATQSASDNTTKIATTAYVTTAIANLADSAPSTLNTLNELAAALGDDANYATTTTNAIAAKAPLASPTLTGNPKINVGTNKNIIFSGGIGEIGSVPGFQAINDAGSANTDFGIRATTIRLATGSAERMRIDASGHVGIGTSSHNVHSGTGLVLHATAGGTGNTGSPRLRFTNTTTGQAATDGAELSLDGNTRNFYIENRESQGIIFYSGSERMRIDSSGRVGIGCTPARDLHLKTEGSTNGFRIQSNDENILFLGAAGSSGTGVDDGYFALDAQGSNKIFMNGSADVPAVLDASGSNNSIRVPDGTTAQRPTGANGMIRYNTTESKFEVYNGMWLPMKTEAPLAFQQASTYHQKWTIAADGQSAQAGSSYSAITVNLNFEGNFTIITKWHHTYMGVGIGYKAGITNGNFTGESNDGAGPYAGGVTVDGFDSTVSLMGQYHWPITNGGGNSILYYIKHQRAGNTISTHYSTNASSATNPSHSSWTQVQTATIASTDHCKPVWGEAHSGETVPLTLLYNDISGGFNGS